jgi:hypothetical protein
LKARVLAARGVAVTLDRRSFLKLAGATASAILFPKIASQIKLLQGTESRPNIIVLLFDAMSARNLSVYGYPRRTTPNLERFAERSIVYHSHYSGGNYTIPGASTLLTGTYPWTHRALNYSGQVRHGMVENNIFRAIGEDYQRVAFGQNVWAHFILTQFAGDIDTLLSPGSYSKLSYLLNDYFPNDRNMAARALDDFMFKRDREPASVLFGPMYRALNDRATRMLDSTGYPRGMPQNVNYPIHFRMEDLFDGLASLIRGFSSPTFAYLHLFPPHAPYRSSDSFFGKFLDSWYPVKKPVHRLGEGLDKKVITTARRTYDEYIATLDWEFGRFLDILEENGVLDNSYVIVTADHGEMLERGVKAHATVLLYDPVVHIPLIISAPGQQNRRDIYSHTHAVDVLPTLTQLAGKPFPAWSEGKLLPELGGVEDRSRSIYIVEAKLNPAFTALTKTTIAMQKDDHKLIYYTGYEAEDSFELYDLTTDLEELDDLYPKKPAVAKILKEELLDSLADADKPYKK